MPLLLSGEILRKICPSIKLDRATEIANIHNKVCPSYGIDSADIMHEFLANELEESGQFHIFEENLYYTRPERLMKVWPSRFHTYADAVPYIRNAEKLANKVYDGRVDLGNYIPGDGYLMRGGGPMQVTGRKNYELFTEFYNKKFGTNITVTEMANLVRQNLEIGIHSACWVFAIAKNLIAAAVADNMKYIVKRINGGYTNMVSRTMFYNLAKKYII